MNLQSKLPIAVEKHTKLELPFDHVTTGMFMLLQPIYYKHYLKTEKCNFNFTSVVRPNPMTTPTFGRIRQNLRHFFVPYRLIFPNWEEYIGDIIASNADYSSQVSGVPYTNADEIMTLFTGYGLSTVVTPPANYDFHFSGSYYKFTRLGRYYYKVFYSLGYDIVGGSNKFEFNMLALLAYAKIYSDWYTNSQYLNDAIYLDLQRYFKYNNPTSSLFLQAGDIFKILSFCRPALYESNTYFEDAWDNPISPNTNQFTAFSFTDPTSTSGSNVSTNSLGTPEMYGVGGSVGTAYLHTALQKLSQYQRRHALSGARAIDRVLAEYGIQTDNLRLQRSIYVGVTSNDVQISSVFATANGTNAQGDSVVGDYAGAGFASGNQSIDFDTDEEGIFITICTIQPSGGYYQGYDRHNRHLTREQFYNASFDTLGVQSIEKGEVYVSKDFDGFVTNGADDYAGHFGFTGRYGEYKRSISRVSGDLALPSVLAGGDAWHMMREFDDTYFNNSVVNIVHDQDFTRGTDAESYLRPFTFTKYEVDPFNIFLHVDCHSYAPCHPLTDSFDWDSEAERITMKSNGPKVN